MLAAPRRLHSPVSLALLALVAAGVSHRHFHLVWDAVLTTLQVLRLVSQGLSLLQDSLQARHSLRQASVLREAGPQASTRLLVGSFHQGSVGGIDLYSSTISVGTGYSWRL